MKLKIIVPVIAFLLLCTEMAMAGTLSVRLNGYDPVNQVTVLEVQNWGEGDLYDIRLSVDNSAFMSVLPGIRGNVGKEIMQTIPTGVHLISLSSGDGQLISKNITLQESGSQLAAERGAATINLSEEAQQEYLNNVAEANRKRQEAIDQQLADRQKLAEELKNKEFEKNYFSSSSTLATTTTQAGTPWAAPKNRIIWILAAVAALSLLAVVYSIIKKQEHRK